MDRTELTLVVGVALFAAVLLGWVLRWIYGLLNPPPPPPPVPDSDWAEYAKSCEQERDAAQARLAEVERDLQSKIVQANAELEATMDGLRDARREVNELRSKLDGAMTAGG
ncbi:MAG: hypothetical protein AAGA32_07160 [Pseudomonadota bacterium]